MTKDGKDSMMAISQELLRQGLEIHSLTMRESTLDDVFLEKVTVQEDKSGFNGTQYRLMLRRR